MSKTYSVEALATILEGELIGMTDHLISRPAQIQKAKQGELTFIGHKKFAKQWISSEASAAVITASIALEPGENKALIKVKDADIAMAKVLELFDPGPPQLKEDVHPSAVIEPSAKISAGVKIGANSYVGKNVSLAEGVVLYPNVTVMDDTSIGAGTIIWSGTVIRERTEIGAMCIFLSERMDSGIDHGLMVWD